MLAPAIARMGPDAVEPLVKNLGSTNAMLQNASRQALQTVGPEAITKLLPHLDDKDPRIRMEILNVLSSHGAIGKEAVLKLVELAKAEDRPLRVRALSLLSQVGPDSAEATPELVKLLLVMHGNTGELQQIIRAMGRIGPGAKAAVPELKKLLAHEQFQVRLAAAESLMQIDASAKNEAVPVLVGVLRDKKIGININTLPRLLINNGISTAELMNLLRDYVKAQPTMKIQVIYGLNSLPVPAKESAPLLRDLLKDANANTRYEAALALARLGADGNEAIPELRAMLKISNANWRDRAAFALKSLGPAAKDAVPDLVEQWRSAANIDLKLRFCEPILSIDKDKGKPVIAWLREQSTSANIFYRIQVLRVLALHDASNPEVLKGLVAATRQQTGYYAGMALDALGQLGPAAKSALPDVRAAMKDRDVVKRARAAQALWKIDGKMDEALPVLIAALSEHDLLQPGAYYTRVPRTGAAAAAWALGEMGSPAKSALPALRQATKLGDLSLRQNALTAIGKIEKE
jgi:HEAT repeat protein